MKKCCGCGEIKRLDDYPAPTRRGKCNACKRIIRRQSYKGSSKPDHHSRHQPRGADGRLKAAVIGKSMTCLHCGMEKETSKFIRNKGRPVKMCRACRQKKIAAWLLLNPDRQKAYSRKQYEKNKPRYAAHVMNRIAKKRNATPSWAEHEKIAVVYKKAKEWGMHVDHIVPLRHPLVCGLHVWQNLQLLAPRENMSKQNRSWPDMPEVG